MKISGTRQAIHDALAWGYLQRSEGSLVEYLTYLTRIQKSGGYSDPSADFLEAAYICAAINGLPNHVGGWLKFAYGPDEKEYDLLQSILASKLRFDLFPISSAKKHERLISMAMTSLEDYRLRLRRNRDMPIAVYCERMKVQQPNFYRDGWGDKLDALLKVEREWDADGVGQVSRVVKSLRGDSDETATEALQDICK